MQNFDVQSVGLQVSKTVAFNYIADPNNLPEWTNAFSTVSEGKAVMTTPEGELEVGLDVESSASHGSIDWRIIFPDGSVARAFSRLMIIGSSECVYSFVLTPPPVPLEMLEGALSEQSKILAQELIDLKRILEQSQ